MTKTSMIKIALAVFSLMLIGNLGTYAQKTDCSKVTGADTVKAIYDKIKVKYPDLMKQINVRIKDGVVTLEGWVPNKGKRKDIEKFAKKTSCVKKVVNNIKPTAGGGCVDGYKPCGEICIPEREDCNISGD